MRGQRLLLLFDACAITCGCSFTVLGVWVDLLCSVFGVFQCFLMPSSPFCFCYLIIVAIVIIIIDYYCYHYFPGASGSV